MLQNYIHDYLDKYSTVLKTKIDNNQLITIKKKD